MSRKAEGKDSVGKDCWGGKKSHPLRLGIAKTIGSRLSGKVRHEGEFDLGPRDAQSEMGSQH